MKLPVEPHSEPEQCLDSPIYRRAIIMDHMPDRVIDYSEYMWMGEEMEEFDRKCLEDFMEDEFIEACIEEMMEEENEIYDYIDWVIEEFLDIEPEIILQHLQAYARSNNIELEFLQDPTRRARHHQLNPEAPEFIPRVRPTHHTSVPVDGPHDR